MYIHYILYTKSFQRAVKKMGCLLSLSSRKVTSDGPSHDRRSNVILAYKLRTCVNQIISL